MLDTSKSSRQPELIKKDGITYEMDDDMLINSGLKKNLILKLFDNSYNEKEYIEIFFACYTLFSTRDEIFNTLSEAYLGASTGDRLRILKVIQYWFKECHELVINNEFIEALSIYEFTTEEEKNLREEILEIINDHKKLRENNPSDEPFVTPLSEDKFNSITDLIFSDEENVEKVAQQLTLLNLYLFKKKLKK